MSLITSLVALFMPNSLSHYIALVERHLGKLSEKERELIQLLEAHLSNGGSLHLPADLLTKIHGKSKVRLLGITYTPEAIRRELTKNVLEQFAVERIRGGVTICDPCCGCGLFPITVFSELMSYGVEPRRALEDFIYFYDVDRISVISSIVCFAFYVSKNYELSLAEMNFNCGVSDFLASKEKFSIFLTNPPYVKLQNLPVKQRESLKRGFSDIASGALGLSIYFLAKMHELLLEGGVVGVITQNNFFTSNSAVDFRKKYGIFFHAISTFGAETVFEGVTAYTCLAYMKKERQDYLYFRRLDSNLRPAVKDTAIANNSLSASKWRLGTNVELSRLSSLETRGEPLGKCCNIWVGIATQFDKAYVVEQSDDGWVGEAPNGERHLVDKELVRPFIRIADIESSEDLRVYGKGVVYPYEIIGDRVVAYDEEFLWGKYQPTMRYLSLWKKELLNRNKGKVLEADWYKWGRIQSMLPVKNKLYTKTFDRGPNFILDESDSLFSNGYAIKNRYRDLTLDFVMQVLNSKFMFYYARLTSFEIKGGFQCYQKNFIERFCIPSFSLETQKACITDPAVLHSELVTWYGFDPED